MSKTLEKLAQTDPRIEDYSNEFSRNELNNDGYWLYLVPGWTCPDTGCHCVHEWNVKDTLRSFRNIERCECDECTEVAHERQKSILNELRQRHFLPQPTTSYGTSQTSKID